MTTIVVIPARGQSKQLPRKNLRMLGGRPLIAHTIDAALGAELVDRVIVSTDDPEIADAAQSAGAEAPFVRPAHLASDAARTADAIVHAVNELEMQGATVTEIVTLQATSPFRTAGMVDEAIRLRRRSGRDSAVSVAPIGIPVSVLGFVDREGCFIALMPSRDPRRQAVPMGFRLTGGIYVSTRALLRSGSLIGKRPAALVFDGWAAMDIDTYADLAAARRRYSREVME